MAGYIYNTVFGSLVYHLYNHFFIILIRNELYRVSHEDLSTALSPLYNNYEISFCFFKSAIKQWERLSDSVYISKDGRYVVVESKCPNTWGSNFCKNKEFRKIVKFLFDIILIISTELLWLMLKNDIQMKKILWKISYP